MLGSFRDNSLSTSDVSGLLADAARHGRELFRAELGLAKAELRHELSRAGAGLVALLVGAGAFGASLVVVAVAAVMAAGAGVVIIGATGMTLAALGAAIAWWGRRRLVAPSLEKTRETIAQNAVAIKKVKDA